MKAGHVLAFAAGAAGTPFAADAATYQYTGLVDFHAGYGNNPFFSLSSPGASATGGATVSATVTRLVARGRTEATGTVSIDSYLKHYGTFQNYSAALSHNQQLSAHLAVQGDVSYENRITPGPSFGTTSADLQPDGDLLTVGQRTRRLSGGLSATWEPNRRDLFQAGVNASHATFSGGGASRYTQTGASVGYLRTLNANTRIGVQAAISDVKSARFPDSRSATIGAQITQRLGPIWRFEGGVSLVAQKQRGGSLFKTLGFNGNLCGKYPKLEVCVLGSRYAAPSGLGGLRTDTQAGARATYKVTPRSTLAITATYDISKAQRGVIPTQKYYDVALDYRRTITPRLSAGASARYQSRDYGTLFAAVPGANSRVSAYTATLNLTYRFGRAS